MKRNGSRTLFAKDIARPRNYDGLIVGVLIVARDLENVFSGGR